MIFANDSNVQVAAWVAETPLNIDTIDTRLIQEVKSDDVTKYTCCHWFAGIGGWELALQYAGWPTDEPVWTGSCPCQPFSVAGKQGGVNDERHLWPEFRRLIATCLPCTIFGEQVAGSGGINWLTEVRFDLENIIYWASFEEALHQVQTAKTHDILSQILGSVIGRVEAALRGLPEAIRERVEGPKQGEANCGSKEKTGQRQRVQETLHREKPSTIPNVNNEESLQEEGNRVRLGSTRISIEQAIKSWSLRNDGIASADGAWPTGVEQSEPGQDQSESWLHIRQCSGGMFRGECGTGELGGRGAHADSYRLVGKADLNDKRRIAERFRCLIAESLARLSKHGVPVSVEDTGYAVGAANLPAACVGAPHIRQRIFWVAHLPIEGPLSGAQPSVHRPEESRRTRDGEPKRRSAVGGVADHSSTGLAGRTEQPAREECETAERSRDVGGLGDAASTRRQGTVRGGLQRKVPAERRGQEFWRHVEYIYCRDGKYRPVERESEPLVARLPRGVVSSGDPSISECQATAEARVMRLKGYGNSIVPQVAAEFVRAFMEARNW